MGIAAAAGAIVGGGFGLATLRTQGHSGNKPTQLLAALAAVAVGWIATAQAAAPAFLLASIAAATFVRDAYLYHFEPEVDCVPRTGDAPFRPK